MSVVLQSGAKKFLKFVGLIALAALAYFGITQYRNRTKTVKQSMEIASIAFPDAPEASLSGNASKLALPSSSVSINGGTKLTILEMPWNAQMGDKYANGGSQTTKGSLFDKQKLQITLVNQPDGDKAKAEMLAFANDLKNNGTNIPGKAMIIMGDGGPAFFASANKELLKLGKDYIAEGVAMEGISLGEDKLMVPLKWKRNPAAAIGGTVATVPRDGDMNILLKWGSDNHDAQGHSLKINPDPTTYDRNAINIIAASDFIDAGTKYINGYTETRRIVENGKTTKKDTTVGVDAVATWTPVDVNIAQKKGGLVVAASTKDYSTQMPATVVTIKKWADDHRQDIGNYIYALAQAGDQVRSFNDAKEFAAEVSAKVWGAETASYWLKYYNGVDTTDRQGLHVELGGSKVFNLVDMANMVGLGKDGLDRYKIVYTTFGDILSKMYPELMPTYPKYEDIYDKSFLQDVIQSHPELINGSKSLSSQNQYASNITEQVSNKSYDIQFDLNQATIKPQSYDQLNNILNSAVVAEGLTLGVYGHTDNTGDQSHNQELSEARAESVKRYLVKKGLDPQRIISKGYGSSKQIEGIDPNSISGRAQNRRVEIVLGKDN